MVDKTIEQYRHILRSDLYAFTHRAFLELNPQTKFLPHPYIDLLTSYLEKVRRGKICRLIINMPPRSLKSHCASIALPAWILGHDPSTQIICASYGQELADRLARECRSLMSAPFYQAMFATRFSLQKQATAEFETTQKGYRLSTSVGGALTGRGADFLIIDDPLKPDDAVSDLRRRAVNDWYDNTLYSRLNNKAHGAIVIIMQRLHEDDLIGHVLAQEQWEVLSFPAIAERDEERTFETPYGQRRFARTQGEALHPEREPLEVLDRIRLALGSYNFAGQYQQAPAPLGGGIIKSDWFQTYDQVPPNLDTIVQSWDTASGKAEFNSYSVCTTWGVKGNQIYLLHVFRKRLDYPNLKRAVRNQADAYQAKVILIENRSSGIALIQEMISEGASGITKYEPEGGDKVARMSVQTAAIENGFVYLPRDAPWLANYLHELLTFPEGTYSDQVDSTAQALDWIRTRRRAYSGWLEYYRREAEKALGRPLSQIGAAAPSAASIRMRAPEPHARHYLSGLNGRAGYYIADANGLVENVHPDDVDRLIAAGWTRE
jgi:predicted phage terminase large subunit-like protein